MTQQDLSVKSKVSVPTIRAIERDATRKFNAANVSAITRALNMPEPAADNFHFHEMIRTHAIPEVQNVELAPEDLMSEIPMFDLSVAAGPWADVVDVPDINSPSAIKQGLFRVRISGDSMLPTYVSGMIVEFRCLRDGQDELVAGKDYYVQRDDGLATFKRLEAMDEQGLVFRALNWKKYRDMIIVARVQIVRMAIARGEFKPF